MPQYCWWGNNKCLWPYCCPICLHSAQSSPLGDFLAPSITWSNSRKL